MLIIEDVEFLDKKKLNIYKRKTKKTQILLFDTQRRFDDYVNKLIYRYDGKYEDIPHYIVTKLGKIYNIFDSDYSSKTFYDNNFDKKIVKVALENLGWLNKNTITGVLNNWIGDIYRGEPYVKNWRNKFYWDAYPSMQIESLNDLINFLCDKHSIPNNFVPSNGFLENIINFEGISCKSNFSNIYTDINPSFNFSGFTKNYEYGKSV